LHAFLWKRVRGFAAIAVHTLVFALAFTLAAAAAGPKDEKPPVQYHIQIPAAPDFSGLNWLIGDWVGKTAPNGPSGEVKLSVNSELEKHFLILHYDVSLAATPTVPAVKESWLGILSPAPNTATYILRSYASTGFITRYRVTTDGPELDLNPEGGEAPPPGWLFRMTWTRSSPDEFTETVHVAPPGKAFFDYYTARFTRVVPTTKPAAPAAPAAGNP
jgi:hypothetical protein